MATKSAQTKVHEAQELFYIELARKTQLERQEIERQVSRYEASQDNHRIYTFNSAVGGGSVADCIAFIGQWAREDPEKAIKIVFDSPGGSVISGFALYDYITQLRADGVKVDTATIGMAASMAGILLQAGEERTMGRLSHLLIHEISTGAIGKLSEIEDEQKFAKTLWDKGAEILAAHSTLDAAQVKRRAKRKDWWLDAAQALELGFCDRIE